MKKNKFLKLGIGGMLFFAVMHLVLIFGGAPNTAPKGLIIGYVGMAALTLFGVLRGVKNS